MNDVKYIISGNGYVGQATHQMLMRHFGAKNENISIYDKYPARQAPISNRMSTPFANTMSIDFELAAFHVICVPTPLMENDGTYARHDLTEVADAIMHAKAMGFSGTTIIRSTMSPSDIELFGKKVIYWPEFMRQRTWNHDAANPIMMVFGGITAAAFAALCCDPEIKIELCRDTKSAALIKLALNSFLAAKLSIASELAQYCESENLSWRMISNAIGNDPRLGAGYLEQPHSENAFSVPKWGYRGACLPKDTEAMARHLNDAGYHMNYAAWATNLNRSYIQADMEILEIPNPPDHDDLF